MRNVICLIAALVALSCQSPAGAGSSREDEILMVSPAVPGELLVVEHQGSLKVVEPKYVGNTVEVDGRSYVLDDALSRMLYERYKAGPRLHTSPAGVLRFDGKVVRLPKGAKVREVWKAIVWRDWVVVLARTSESDAIAKLEPPFFCNELVAFRTDGSQGMIRWLASRPGYNLAILRRSATK